MLQRISCLICSDTEEAGRKVGSFALCNEKGRLAVNVSPSLPISSYANGRRKRHKKVDNHSEID